MEARSINRKTFQLTENGQLLGELVYKNLFFLSGKIKLSNSDVFEIKPVGIFGASFKVTKNETEIANLRMNWRGRIVFTFQDGQEFVLKAKGVFTETGFNELSQSYYFLMAMRLKHQANQIITNKKEPDNYIDINGLTKIEQATLIEIFKVISNFQSRIRIYFTNNLFG